MIVPTVINTIYNDGLITTYLNDGAGASIRLFKSDTPLSPTTVLADLTEADFTGYTAGGIPATAWTYAFDPDTGDPVALCSDLAFWQVTGGANLPQTIYGFMVVRDGGIMIGARRFDTPQNLASLEQAIQFPVRINLTERPCDLTGEPT